MKDEILVLCLYLLFLPNALEFQTSNGLKLELIHLDSPKSPHYTMNLTRIERIQRLVNLSKARAHNLAPFQSTNKTNTKIRQRQYEQSQTIRPTVGWIDNYSVYTVKIGIGTFNHLNPRYLSYYLAMDTGSELTWIQCVGCKRNGHHCYPQRQQLFDDSQSSSYNFLRYGIHNLCYPNKFLKEGYCFYQIGYADGSHTYGILGSETLTFPSSLRRDEYVPGFVFGCGTDNYMEHVSEEEAGVLGLGWGPRSFVSQTRSQSKDQFSYCLQHMELVRKGFTSLLRFGADIVPEEGFSSITLGRVRDAVWYYLDLQGISLGDRRLHIPVETFHARPDYTGGTIIDTGAPFTHLTRIAYDRLKDSIEAYFAPLRNFERARTTFDGFDICYIRLSSRFTTRDQRPSITFHFAGANLKIEPENAFIWSGKLRHKKFCLAMLPSGSDTMLGSYQQANTRFIYDLKRSKLFFKAADCSQRP